MCCYHRFSNLKCVYLPKMLHLGLGQGVFALLQKQLAGHHAPVFEKLVRILARLDNEVILVTLLQVVIQLSEFCVHYMPFVYHETIQQHVGSINTALQLCQPEKCYSSLC